MEFGRRRKGMKKVVALLLIGSLAAVFALSGCGSKEEVIEDITMEPDEGIPAEEIDITDLTLPDRDDTIYIEPLSKDFADINFEYDQYRVLDRDVPTLEAIAGWLAENPESRVLIEGHCDERGTNEYNMALGEQRALSARRYLVSLGVSPDRLTTISYGEERPVAIGSNEAAWAENRRAHFAVSM
jgi:peptidoglycan-associated lipoprotein